MLLSHKLRSALLLTLLVLLLTACGTGGQTVAPTPGGNTETAASRKLVVTQQEETRDLRTIDPLKTMDLTIPSSLVYDTLLRRTTDGKLLPVLAESFEQTSPTVWRFRLRRGVQFHDGSSFSSADVKATIELILKPETASGYQRFLATITAVNAVDEQTVDLVTSVPNALSPYLVAPVPMLSARQLGLHDNSYKTRLIGTGPYTLKEWKQAQSVSLARNTRYWGAAPAFDEITVKAVEEPATRLADLLSDNAQLLGDLPAHMAAQVTAKSGYRVVREPGVRTGYITFWFKPPFDNALVRQAIYHAIDRQALAQAVYGQYATPSTGPVQPSYGGAVEAFPLSDYNPKRAQQLLQQAGVTLPLKVDLDVAQADATAAQVIQSQLRAVGIEVQINPLDKGSVLDGKRLQPLATGRLLLFTALDNRVLDALRPYEAFYSQNSFLKTLGYQPDARHQRLIDQYMAAADARTRRQLSEQIAALGKEIMPAVFLYFPDQLYGLGPDIDWQPAGMGQILFSDIKGK